MAAISRPLLPCIARYDALVCLKSWKRKSRSSARITAFVHAFLMSTDFDRLRPGNTSSPAASSVPERFRSNYPTLLNNRHHASFAILGIVQRDVSHARSTQLHSKIKYSPRRMPVATANDDDIRFIAAGARAGIQ